MEIVTALLVGTTLGYFAPSSRKALVRYLIAWAVVFPIQTAVVHAASDGDDIEPIYFALNALILAGGIGLNQLAHRYGARRARPSAKTLTTQPKES